MGVVDSTPDLLVDETHCHWGIELLLGFLDNCLILQNFYNGLTQSSRDHVDAATSGAFFSLTIEKATSLIKKMLSNQGWSDDRLQPRHWGMHSIKKADMLAMKIDLHLKKF